MSGTEGNPDIKTLSKLYDMVITATSEMMVMRGGIPPANTVMAMHAVHLNHLQKTYEAMQLCQPPGERVSFSDYLRKVADAQEGGI